MLAKLLAVLASLLAMPELPDISAYITALEPRILGQPLERVRITSPFLLRTAEPPIAAAEGKIVRELRRVGKRIAFGFEDQLWLVLHLMIAGRLHWRPVDAKLGGGVGTAHGDRIGRRKGRQREDAARAGVDG